MAQENSGQKIQFMAGRIINGQKQTIQSGSKRDMDKIAVASTIKK